LPVIPFIAYKRQTLIEITRKDIELFAILDKKPILIGNPEKGYSTFFPGFLPSQERHNMAFLMV